MSDTWTGRAVAIAKDKHVRKQVKRLMKARRIIHGTRDVMSFQETVRAVAQLIAILEAKPEVDRTANVGGITVSRGQGTVGYDIHLWASSVYVDHMTPYREARNAWESFQWEKEQR